MIGLKYSPITITHNETKVENNGEKQNRASKRCEKRSKHLMCVSLESWEEKRKIMV